MSLYDYDQPPPAAAPQPKPSSSRMVYNIATAIALLGSLCLCLVFLGLFVNPYAALNPFPPPTQVGVLQLPTATWTPLQLPATWTPTPSLEPSATWSPQPSVTPGVIDTPITLPSSTSQFTATVTPRPSATPRPTGAPFTASVQPVDSTIVHPDLGCSWWGVGGTAVDLRGNPIVGIIVKLGGALDGRLLEGNNAMLTVSGTAPIYGQGGYEFKLGDVPEATRQQMYMQLLDQAALPLSDKVYFDTFADCSKNLILIRFKQVR